MRTWQAMDGYDEPTFVEKTADSEDTTISDRERAIIEACKWRNLEQLRIIAESPGGFLTDNLRQLAWPVLLGLPPSTKDIETADSTSWKQLPRHRDEDQVQLDVNRAFIYYPEHKNDAELDQQKTQLSNLILEVLRRNPYLYYFQGYHDICQVLLLVLPPHLRAPAVSRLSALRIRDFMLPSLAPAISQLRLIPDILLAADPALWRHLSSTEPFFALSGTLTMYAHDITTLGEISRLFDVLLAREPVFSVYMFAAIVRGRREELFDTPADEPEMLHSILSKLPRPLDLEAIIKSTSVLFEAHPPETLVSWRGISRASVLKTARDADVCAAQTMEEGEGFFLRQVRELNWLERRDKFRAEMWRYRRPAGAVGIAVLVGIAAVLLRRPGTGAGPVAYLSALVARWGR